MTATLEYRRAAYCGPTSFDVDDTRRERASRRSLEVRQARAELKRRIGAGELELAAVVLDGYRLHPDVRGITLVKLMRSAPAFGEVRTSKTLRAARLSPNRPLGSLARLERLRLATEIKAHTPRAGVAYGRSVASDAVRLAGLRRRAAAGTLSMVPR